MFICNRLILYHTDAQLVDPIPFQLTSDPAAQSVSFSLTCTSNGGPISTMKWRNDGMAVSGSNIYPDLTNNETATYINVLQVSGRETGTYSCDATDGAGTISLSITITVQGKTNIVTFIYWGEPERVTSGIFCLFVCHGPALCLFVFLALTIVTFHVRAYASLTNAHVSGMALLSQHVV